MYIFYLIQILYWNFLLYIYRYVLTLVAFCECEKPSSTSTPSFLLNPSPYHISTLVFSSLFSSGLCVALYCSVSVLQRSVAWRGVM